MPATKVQQATSTGAAPALNGVVAGNFVYLFSHAFRSGSVTAETAATDSNGTVTTQDRLAVASGPDGILAAAYYVPNANAGTHTFTCQNFGAGAQERAVFEFSGVEKSANPLDVKTSNSTTVAGATSVTTGTTSATGQADELILVGATLGGSPGVLSVGWTDPIAGFTALAKFSNDSTDIAGLTNFKNVAVTGTQTATFNWTDNTANPQGAIALIGAFRNAIGGAAPLQTAKPLLMTLQRDTSMLRAMPIPSYLRDSIAPDIVPATPGNTQQPILAAFERRFGRMPMGRILPVVPAQATAGVLAASGDASASFIGQSTAASTLSGAGDATGAFVGKSLAAATLSAPGDATATFTGKALAAAVLSAPGDASATFVGRSTAASVLSGPADATAAFVGKSDAAAVLSAPADSAASFIGRSDASAVWAALATATGAFVGTSQVAGDSVLSASADSTGIFVGQSLAAAVLAAVAEANADWRGDFTVPIDTSIDGSGMRFTARQRGRKRTPEDIAREQKMVQDYLDELERKEALAQVPEAATPGSRVAEADSPALTGFHGLEPATSVKGTDRAAPAPVLPSVARVNALQRMAELEEEALEAERNEQQQQRRRAAASAVLLMSY